MDIRVIFMNNVVYSLLLNISNKEKSQKSF